MLSDVKLRSLYFNYPKKQKKQTAGFLRQPVWPGKNALTCEPVRLFTNRAAPKSCRGICSTVVCWCQRFVYPEARFLEGSIE